MDRDGTGEQPEPAIGGGRGRGPTRGAALVVELGVLLLLLMAVAGTCGVLILAHGRAAPANIPSAVQEARPSEADPAPQLDSNVLAPLPDPAIEVVSEPEPEFEPEPAPPEPLIDPTAEALAALATRKAALIERVGEAARRVEATREELSGTAARAEERLDEARRADRRRMELSAEAARREAELQLLALERDVLERKRDEVEQRRREAIERPGYAILPYKGPSGTWRRPIPVECANGSATLEPGGLSFSMVELMALPGRPGPFGGAVKRLASLLEREGAPDGVAVEPYVVFVVRPDGIRPFYEARSSLDAVGIPYGYELVDQDWAIEYPSWDDPTIWDALDSSLKLSPPSQEAMIGGDPGRLAQGREAGDGGWGNPGSPGSSSAINDIAGPLARGAGARSFGDLIPSDEAERGRYGNTPGITDRSDAGRSIVPDLVGGIGGADDVMPPGRSYAGEGVESAPFGSPEGLTGTASSERSERPTGPVGRSASPAGSGIGTGIGWRNGDPGSARPGVPNPGLDVESLLESIGADRIGRPDLAQGSGGTDAHSPGGSPRSSGGTRDGASAMPDGVDSSNPAASGGPSVEVAQDGAASRGGGGLGAGAPRRRIELVIACGRKGVTIHPGGYRLSEEAVKADDGRLTRAVEAVLASRRRLEPACDPVPEVRFLVEPGGYGLYWSARGQVELARPEWPIAWQATEPRTFTLFGSERW